MNEDVGGDKQGGVGDVTIGKRPRTTSFTAALTVDVTVLGSIITTSLHPLANSSHNSFCTAAGTSPFFIIPLSSTTTCPLFTNRRLRWRARTGLRPDRLEQCLEIPLSQPTGGVLRKSVCNQLNFLHGHTAFHNQPVQRRLQWANTDAQALLCSQ